MKLILVPVGKQFKIADEIYVHDLTGRNGSGKIAVYNLKTGEKTKIKAETEVDIVEETAETIKKQNEELKTKKEQKDGNNTKGKQTSSGKVLPSFWDGGNASRKKS